MTLIELIIMYHRTICDSGREEADHELAQMGVDEVIKKAISDSFNDDGEALNCFGGAIPFSL